MKQRLHLVVLGAAALLAFSSLPQQAAALNFNYPFYKGRDVDYCLWTSRKDSCGAPAADAWCRALGYDRTTSFTGPSPSNKTASVGSNQTCTATSSRKCSAFVAINCIREKLFLDPRVQGKLLDWCLKGTEGCGREAANEFCTKQGFSHGAWSCGGPYQTIDSGTYQLGSGRTCNPKSGTCKAFSSIFCEK